MGVPAVLDELEAAVNAVPVLLKKLAKLSATAGFRLRVQDARQEFLLVAFVLGVDDPPEFADAKI